MAQDNYYGLYEIMHSGAICGNSHVSEKQICGNLETLRRVKSNIIAIYKSNMVFGVKKVSQL